MKIPKLSHRNKPIQIGSVHVVTDFWHFLFPSKTEIQKDADSWAEFDGSGKLIRSGHISYTLRNFLVHQLYKWFMTSAREFAKILKINPTFASQIGAVAFDAAVTEQNTGTTSPATFSHTCTGANLVLFLASFLDGTAAITDITYNSVSSSALNTVNSAPASVDLYLRYLAGPATGANTVSVAWSGTPSFSRSYASSYTGAAQTGIPDAQNTGAQAGGSSLAVIITVVATGCWVVAFERGENSGKATSVTNVTTNRSGTDGGFWDSGGTVSTGSFTATANWAIAQGAGSGMCIASFAPVGSAIKTIDGLARASVKTVDGLSYASVKSFNGLQ